jgi:hypothetical protein
VKHAGLDVLRATHANSLLMPVAIFQRQVLKRIGLASGSDVRPLPTPLRWLNPVLTAALRSEARWLTSPRARLKIGLSAICVAQKPPEVHRSNS